MRLSCTEPLTPRTSEISPSTGLIAFPGLILAVKLEKCALGAEWVIILSS